MGLFIVMDLPEEEMPEITELVVEVMEGVAELDVPLTVDVATGADLASMKD